MPDIFNRSTEEVQRAPIVACDGHKIPGLHLNLALPALGSGSAEVKLEITDSDGNLVKHGLIQKLTFTLDANDMVPKAVMEFIPGSVVITGPAHVDFKPITLFADMNKDSNGTEFSRQWTLDQPEAVYVKPAESSDGKVD
jgi:hypothetical protein